MEVQEEVVEDHGVAREVHLAVHLEVHLEVVRAEAALTNHKDLSQPTLIIQKTTIMALKNETKSSRTRTGQSL